jgi:predicted DNA-binding antitoxin AbrB/MazE fold protein
MIQRITAIVENGHLRPEAPLQLPNGSRVEIILDLPGDLSSSNGTSSTQKDPKKVHQLLSEIAAMPLESDSGFSNRDHDQILYGEKGAR